MEEQNIITKKSPLRNNKNRKLSLMFKILSVITAVVGIVLGITLGFDEVSTYSIVSRNFVTTTVFELWRAFIFWFSGLCSSLCLFAVSMVFSTLDKK